VFLDRLKLNGIDRCPRRLGMRMQQNRLEHEIRAEHLPLSQAQLSIWLVQMLDRDDPCYNISECVEILGAVDERCFEEAFREVFAKNDAWHIRIAETENGPRQYFHLDLARPFDVHDFSNDASPRDSAQAWMEKDRSKAFNLDGAPLYRFALLRISSDHYFWYAVAHHLIIDGFGWLLFLERVAATYTAKLKHKPVEIDDCGSWRELLVEELSYRGSERFQRDRSFWSTKLSNLPERSTLSGKPPRWPSAFMKTTGWLPRTVDLEGFARRHGSSVTAVLVAATAIYLHRVTGAHDLMIGLPVHARVGPKMRSIVGMVANALTLRVAVDAQDSVADIVGQATRTLREAMRHQKYRYEDIRRDLGIGLRDGELAGTVVNYTPRDHEVKFGDAPILENPLGNWWVEDLQIVYYGGRDPRGLRIDAICNPANYNREELELHLRRFVNLLARIAVEPVETPVARVQVSSPEEDELPPLLSEVERLQVLYDWNATEAEYPVHRCIHELFEEQAAKTPEAVAVIFEDVEVSYAKLNAKANRLAHWLMAKGVKPDERVAIAVERSIEMVVALLGTLKAGGAYVPLDPAYPVERLQFMLQDSAPRVLLTQEAVLTRLGEIPAEMSVLMLDGAEGAWRECSPLNPDPRAMRLTSSNVAYVIYTSGSTGTPKGVMIEHKSLQSSTNARFRAYDNYERFLLLSSMSFDSSVAGIFGTLLRGGSLFLATPEAAADPKWIGRRLADAQITSILAVPSLLNALAEECQFEVRTSLKHIIAAGEECTVGLVEKIGLWAPQAGLFNEYGPTEATVWATVYRCLPGQSRDSVPIGKPIANTRIYILDGTGEPVPVGVTGELYIGGAGVARGYLNRPELTLERFLRDPFAAGQGQANARMYRTGDLGRWLPDGNIEFQGRNDLQVKIRGFRIELGEIEAVLRTLPGVRDAAVVALDDGPDSKRLVAFIACDPSGPPEDSSVIRAGLANQLPDAFLPTAFVVLPKLPRLPNGKLDRHALAVSDAVPTDRRPDAAPLRTPTEFVLAEIWSDILRRPVVNRDEDYFELGGDSLRATILATRIRRVFGVDLPLRDVFESRALHALASRIEVATVGNDRQGTMPAIERASDGGLAPLSFSQHRMWLIQSLDPQNTAYNMSGAIRLNGEIDVAALSSAIAEVCRRHEILRTTYDMVDGDIVQLTHELQGDPISFSDLTVQYSDPEAEMMRRVNAEARRSIDLAKGPVFSCALMRVGPNEHVLQTTVHHIAGDQWSIGLIGREISALYNAAREGRQAELPSAPIRYRDFAVWQQKFLQSAELSAQLDYWKGRLRNVPHLELPSDRRRPPVQTLNGSHCQRRISDSLLEAAERLGHRYSTTLFMTMFAAFAALLQRLAGQTDISVGVPIANRTHGAVDLVVGTFVNTLVFRVDLSGDPTFSELLSRVRALSLEAFANQDVPFDKLVQEIAQVRDPSRGPLTQVLFNMLNAPMHGIEMEGIAWKPILIDRGGAQFELSLSVDRQITQTVTVEYNTDLFDRSSIERFIGRYLRLLESAVETPNKRLSQLEVLPDDERLHVLRTWNATRTNAPTQPFIRMFEAQAESRPNAPAVRFAGKTLSYGELDARANILADRLSRRGAGRGAFIGICLDRSLEMLVALLAVQKTGGAYVPLDPGLPSQRLKFMISDSGVALIVSSSDVAGKLDLPESVQLVDIGSAERCHTPATSGLASGPANSDAAYMIYTSGSTGVPKGVVISHGALANFLCSMLKEPGLTESDVLAAVTTISFDIAGLELYLPLLAGARIELVPSSTAGDGRALADLLRQCGATVMQATPSTWQMLLDAGWPGGKSFRALCGGEALSSELAKRLVERAGELWNLYGPTETTIWSTAGAVDSEDASISIGRPIDNTQIYVLNGDAPAPIGVAGEICIGGAGVAIGYHNRPELTDERFRPDPFSGQTGDQLYRTGDLARWGADGRLYHLGRMDHQVKIRGFRIELGEIEAVLHAHPAVRQAAVAAHEAGPADTRLVAYVAYREGKELTATELRHYIRDQLPEYMVPSIAVGLDRLPLTPNGKLDRNALANPFGSVRAAVAVEPPAPGTEAMVADIWRKYLKTDAVGAEDNFFDLGGHSLLALRVVVELEVRTGARVDPRSLFFQTLRQFSAAVGDLAGDRK
jgi:nonribosomal peptide synthetase DhbF